MNCCNPFTGVCERGFNCPAGSEEPLPVLDLPAPVYCERAKQNCATRYTCASLCRLITANSDNSGPDERPGQLFGPRYQRILWLYFFANILAWISFGLYRIFLN